MFEYLWLMPMVAFILFACEIFNYGILKITQYPTSVAASAVNVDLASVMNHILGSNVFDTVDERNGEYSEHVDEVDIYPFRNSGQIGSDVHTADEYGRIFDQTSDEDGDVYDDGQRYTGVLDIDSDYISEEGIGITYASIGTSGAETKSKDLRLDLGSIHKMN